MNLKSTAHNLIQFFEYIPSNWLYLLKITMVSFSARSFYSSTSCDVSWVSSVPFAKSRYTGRFVLISVQNFFFLQMHCFLSIKMWMLNYKDVTLFATKSWVKYNSTFKKYCVKYTINKIYVVELKVKFKMYSAWTFRISYVNK